MPQQDSSWMSLVQDIVERMPERFTLHDLDAHFDSLRRFYPRNRNVDAKVRQILQQLRDREIIAFLGAGKYQRLVPRPRPTLKIDFKRVSGMVSASQRARIALEAWTKLNLWCHSCGCPTLLSLPPNAPVSDFRCAACKLEYQVKAQRDRFRGIVLGAAYAPCFQRAMQGNMPDYLLIEYDVHLSQVIFVDVIRGHEITADRVISRKELSSKARRKGWTGCQINIDGLNRVPIVAPAFLART